MRLFAEVINEETAMGGYTAMETEVLAEAPYISVADTTQRTL